MQRDMELIRKLLLAGEQHEHGYAPRDLEIEGYSDEQVGYHCYLLGDAGLAEVIEIPVRGSESPLAELRNLTWSGHEFLDAAKDNTNWERAKQRLAAAGQSLLTVPLSVLTALLIDEGKRRLGIL